MIDDVLGDLRKIECSDDLNLYTPDLCKRAAAEIERLRARDADLVADVELLGGLALEMVRALERAGLSATAAEFTQQIGGRLGKREDRP